MRQGPDVLEPALECVNWGCSKTFCHLHQYYEEIESSLFSEDKANSVTYFSPTYITSFDIFLLDSMLSRSLPKSSKSLPSSPLLSSSVDKMSADDNTLLKKKTKTNVETLKNIYSACLTSFQLTEKDNIYSVNAGGSSSWSNMAKSL